MNPLEATLKVENETLNFIFNKIVTLNGEKFFVNVKKGAEYFAFDITKSDCGKWRILDPAPIWAKALEDALSIIITQNFKTK